MLSNAYFLAKFRFDTAENEPAKNLQNFANFPNFPNPCPDPPRGEDPPPVPAPERPGPARVPRRPAGGPGAADGADVGASRDSAPLGSMFFLTPS